MEAFRECAATRLHQLINIFIASMTQLINQLPIEQLTRLHALVAACQWVASQPRKVEALERAAVNFNGRAVAAGWQVLSAGNMRKKYYDWQKSKQDPASLIDGRRMTGQSKSRASSSQFIAYLALLATRHQRCNSSAIHDLYAQWRRGEQIPGYEGANHCPNLPLPKGWSVANLMRRMPDKRTLSLHRQGARASAGMMAQVYSTRAGLWPCSHVLFDDVWLDMYVSGYADDGRAQLGRPLQLGALDYYTGKRISWGTKLRSRRADGSNAGLNGDEMTLLLVQYLCTVGYSPRGTVLVVENGTASISKALEAKLLELSGGLVRVDRSGITGHRQATPHAGRGVGNPRHKAALESWHNLLHNRLDDFALASGHDRTEPEVLHGQRRLATREINALATLSPERAAMLATSAPSMLQLADKLASVVGGINARRNHELEGWQACGFEVDEYSLTGAGAWVDASNLVPDVLQLARSLALVQPSCYNRRKMSPQEAWELSTSIPENKLIRFNPAQAVMLMGAHSKFPLAIKGGAFKISSKKRHHSELLYETCVITPEGYALELPYGANYYGIFNPFGEALIVLDERERVLGCAKIISRVQMDDESARLQAWGRQNQRNVESMERARNHASAPDNAQERIRQGYNAAIMAGDAMSPQERVDAKILAKPRRSSSKGLALPSLSPCEGLAASDDWDSGAVPAASYAPDDEGTWGLPQSYQPSTFMP